MTLRLAPPSPLGIAALAALPMLLAILPACAGARSGEGDDARPARTRQSAKDLEPSERFEIRFGSELVGYLTDVLPAPAGAEDLRAYEPGTAVIQGLDHQLLGFISPHGTTYRFDASGEARVVGFGSRNTSIAAFFLANGPPTLIPVKE